MSKDFSKSMKDAKSKIDGIWKIAEKVALGKGTSKLKAEWGTHPINVTIEVVQQKDLISLIARGEDVLYYEFGTGITYSSIRHPRSDDLGMGAGTHSPLGRWNSPNGWWYRSDSDPGLGQQSKETSKGETIYHTFGLPAYMSSYKSFEYIKEEIMKQIGEHLHG